MTGEQQCRARVHGEERIRDFAYCNLWKPHLTRDEALQWFAPLERRGWHSWPCTSPRRNQCRNATAGRGRNITPARWGCTEPFAFYGPLRYDPFRLDPWRWSMPMQRYFLP